MRLTSTVLARSALLALTGSIWAAGCYRLSSDCDVAVTCPSYATAGSGGAPTTSSSSSAGGATSVGSASSSSASASSSSGSGGCTMVADCDDMNPCTHDTCNAGKCANTSDDTAIPDDMNPCTKDTCLGGAQHHDPEAGGTPCPTGVCDGAGACVVCAGAVGCDAAHYCFGGACLSCNDGIKNGDETDVDCGGSHCGTCALGKGCVAAADCAVDSCVGGACLGATCANATKDGTETDVDCGGPDCLPCATGKHCGGAGADCANGICFDHVCCATSCSGVCTSCAVPGKLGTCSSVPQGVDDPDSFCFMQAVCDVGSACVAASNKGHFGDPCAQDSGCFNGTCRAGYCKLQNGDACAEDAACGSARCSSNVCAACATGADCASGTCNAGTCLFPGGFLCAGNADCASSQCVGGVCNDSGGACTTAGCPIHFCKNGLCQTCSTSADCPLSTPCVGGSCKAPPGAYCSLNAKCASGTCAPAAFLSMRKCQ